MTRKDEEDIGMMLQSDFRMAQQIDTLYKIVNFDIEIAELEKKLAEEELKD